MIFFLSLTQTTNYRLFQSARICRQKFQFHENDKKDIQKGRKHCGKRRNCHVFKKHLYKGNQISGLSDKTILMELNDVAFENEEKFAFYLFPNKFQYLSNNYSIWYCSDFYSGKTKILSFDSFQNDKILD